MDEGHSGSDPEPGGCRASEPADSEGSRQGGCPAASGRSEEFRRRHFAGSSPGEWGDWRWQLRHRLRDLGGLGRVVRLTPDEEAAVGRLGGRLPVGVTPYYASLIDPEDPSDPVRRMMVPRLAEFERSPGEADDPLAEDGDAPVPGLVHRYPDRVLLLATSLCASYCRYCTRARMVGRGERHCGDAQLGRALDYIAAHGEVRDVLLSGGDPLTMSDDRLGRLLSRLHAISHVEIVRIGTKVPAVLPQRVTPDLVRTLRRFHPLWASLHFMHPAELTPECAEACGRLADAGIPLGSQTVLAKGVNDDVGTMTRLAQGLLRLRVRPYYLYQCDPISGSAHFRTPVSKGLEIVRGLRGHTTGYACPTFVIDAPGGGGKVALWPDSVAGREGGDLLLRGYDGRTFRYPDAPQDF